MSLRTVGTITAVSNLIESTLLADEILSLKFHLNYGPEHGSITFNSPARAGNDTATETTMKPPHESVIRNHLLT